MKLTASARRAALLSALVLATLAGSAQSGRKPAAGKPASAGSNGKSATPAPGPDARRDAKKPGGIVDMDAKLPSGSTGPVKEEDDIERIYTNVEILPAFPGGPEAWGNFLRRNLNGNVPVRNGAPAGTYRVRIQFIVDQEGGVSEVKALNDPGFGMTEEAVRVIRNGPRWTPGMQNGRPVKTRFTQVIAFGVS
ncbi:MAG: hypothetical protein EOO11_16220 [Chitinophagaceae bacterium]|nr:MAG: hypothetical protein EOO11_16220 [Chitinophagaceae bacterium]